MGKTARLILTDSYYGVFSVLTDELNGKTAQLDQKNFIFCEEKISLMAERAVCAKFGGTFNTEIYSFGNYLKNRKKIDALSKEGSAMAVKRILGEVRLETLKAGKADLAPSLFDLIVQLKSSSVSDVDLKAAAETLTGERAKKIRDVAEVYSAYEKFIKDGGYIDQSQMLSYLPEVINSDAEIAGAVVYLLGYNSWTAQARQAVKSLLANSKQVTAILTGGENGFLYLNETADFFRKICREENISLDEKFYPSYDVKEAQILSDIAFNPLKISKEKVATKKIIKVKADFPETEAEFIASTVAQMVKRGARYKDFTIAVPDVDRYGKKLKYYFELLSIPYFIDEKINPVCHPLVRLICAYFDMFRKNFDKKSVEQFFKNRLYCADKKRTDLFELYCNKFNIGYDRFKKPFTLGDEKERQAAESFRKQLEVFLTEFNLNKLLKELNVKEKIDVYTEELKSNGEQIAAEANSQTYDAVIKILSDMDKILSGVKIDLLGMKNVFLSGIKALELSIIPQFGDAVYVGDYRKTALAKANYLFAPGLNASVPTVKEDVAVLNDDDIKALSGKLVIDPTVKIVNRRAKENFGVAMMAFENALFLSCPDADDGGKRAVKSDFLTQTEKAFTCTLIDAKAGGAEDFEYMSLKQGAVSFAADCRDFCDGKLIPEQMKRASAFYQIVGEQFADALLAGANKRFSQKIRLDGVREQLFSVASPTKIEDFYDCPYKAFASRILRLKETDDGSITASVAGNFMHEIFKLYFKSFDKIKDSETSDRVFEQAVNSVLEDDRYKKFFEEAQSRAVINRIIGETKSYCFKAYLNLASDSDKPRFVPDKLEEKIFYTLPKTKLKITGTVDRTDLLVGGDYSRKKIRIVDYKSGKVSDADKMLYVGKKLQLYLYAAAFSEAADIVGVYYALAKEEYSSKENKKSVMAVGKTVDDQNIIQITSEEKSGTLAFADTVNARNSGTEKTVSSDTLNACISYAVRLCENAVRQMRDGVIVASPYGDACAYCKFKGLCPNPFENVRTVSERIKSSSIASIELGDIE